MGDRSYSQKIARASGSNFYYSFFFLPREKREGIMAVYAFSRLVDDAVDEASSEEVAQAEIDLWRRRLQACYQGLLLASNDPLYHPLLPELQETIRRFEISSLYFEDLLKGVEMDLIRKRYATFQELELYCYHVAGTIGLLCNQLFGLKEERAQKYAIVLGTAFQLTNIIRDVGSDAELGRIYLPQEDLRRFDISEEDIFRKRRSPQFKDLMNFEAGRAEEYFQRAFQILPANERRRLIPAEIMTAVYYRILQKLKKEDFPVFERKVSLSTTKKLGLILWVVISSFFRL